VFPVKTVYRYRRGDIAGYTEATLIGSISITYTAASAWSILAVGGR
jgi:hypothetical protein